MLRYCGVFALLALLVACGGGSDENEPPVTGNGAPSPEASPTPPGQASTSTDPTGPLPGVRLQRVFPSLTFNQMTGLYPGPEGRWYVLERPGRIMVFDDRNDASQATVFLDIRSKIDASGAEMGLLGLALAPDFSQTGIFYVNYTAGNPRRTVIARFRSSGGVANPASEEILLTVGQPFPNHNGGQTSFGPDGYLYIGLGDGGSARDPMGNGQNQGVLLGKLLRIDVSGTSGGRSYRIPPDNPFAGRSGVSEEIWAWGLRNPWRFSWDIETGALWLADVGQNAVEEIDVITKGGNYGWNIMEGNQCLSGSSCNRDGLAPPVYVYENSSENCSVTGGFVYRGQSIPGLSGAYVYGDYCSGRIWALRWDGSQVTTQGLLADGAFQLSSFAQGHDGEVYALAYGASGGIFKLVS